MKFKIDENLKVVAVAKGNPDLNIVASELLDAFIYAEMIEMKPAETEIPVLQAIGPQYVSDVCSVLGEYLYSDETHTIPADVFDAFCKLVILPGGCPECGGEIDLIETEGHEKNDGNYYVPNTYVVDNYVYQCRECGKTIKSEKEL